MRDRGARGRSEVIDMQRTSRGKANVKSRAYIVHRAPRRCCLESKKEGKKKEEEWRMLNTKNVSWFMKVRLDETAKW